MNREDLKLLLDSHTGAFKSALEVFVTQMTNKQDQFQEKIIELKTSLEYSQKDIDDLKKEITQLKNEKKKDEEKIKHLEGENLEYIQKIGELEVRCNNLDDASRKNNIRIDGLSEDGGETWEQTALKVSKLIKDTMKIPDVVVDRTQRVGPRSEQRPRTVIARFARYTDRDAVMRNAKMLHGTNIYFNEDLCPASQKIKMDQLPAFKQAKRDGKIAFFRNTKLIIRPQPTSDDGDTNDREQQLDQATTPRTTTSSSDISDAKLLRSNNRY